MTSITFQQLLLLKRFQVKQGEKNKTKKNCKERKENQLNQTQNGKKKYNIRDECFRRSNNSPICYNFTVNWNDLGKQKENVNNNFFSDIKMSGLTQQDNAEGGGGPACPFDILCYQFRWLQVPRRNQVKQCS